jgi:hypothetical protein
MAIAFVEAFYGTGGVCIAFDTSLPSRLLVVATFGNVSGPVGILIAILLLAGNDGIG